MKTDRRTFLQLVSTGALAAAFPASIKRALAIPAHHRTGTIADVEHIVILMQENRSFDHYFGTLRGVRGFGDPRAVTLPSGDAGLAPAERRRRTCCRSTPTRPTSACSSSRTCRTTGPTRTRPGTSGKYDQWVPHKGTTTMAYLTRDDIPFHYALADAFTICDAYHCSFLGATDPNRYHMWTGWVGNDGQDGGPVLNNAEAGYDWSTYPGAPAGGRHLLEDLSGRGRRASTPRTSGAGATTRTSATTATTRCSTSTSTRTPQPGSPLFEGARDGDQHLAGRDAVRSSSGRTWRRQRCRRCRGSSRPRRTPSTRTGRRTTAPGTSRRSSTR